MKVTLLLLLLLEGSAAMTNLNRTAHLNASSTACDVACKGIAKTLACDLTCEGIDTDICKGSKWILCKAGCLGIKSCVHKCEKKIVDPCKHNLVDKCEDKCTGRPDGPCGGGCVVARGGRQRWCEAGAEQCKWCVYSL